MHRRWAVVDIYVMAPTNILRKLNGSVEMWLTDGGSGFNPDRKKNHEQVKIRLALAG